ncbi:hypothetical protein KZ686_10405 [Cupriavidus cauae]|uniref:hypothetical protein n=1 Tax=Cupriavidus TaxID=106589 RepID=UPI001CF18FA7|nr:MULTISPECIES: hypothetical protein [Cupriavidus]MCA7083301.1 hypothetical protein [Cupriavidus sp. DB3]UZN48240.1 hypothetical protein KZ686_10405 [Cupriavidus cauae]
MSRRRVAGLVAAIGAAGAAAAAVLAWSAPAAAAGDTVLSTASPPRAGNGVGNSVGNGVGNGARTGIGTADSNGKSPAQRQRDAARGMPAVPALPPPQPYPSGQQMPVYVGPDGVVAVPSIDMTPNSGVVYGPPPPRSGIVEDRKR